MVDYTKIPLGFFTNHNKVFFSRVDETMWRSLTQFGVNSGVELVQALITR